MAQPGTVKQICAVYDKVTGRIVHLHHNIAVAGASPPSEAELHATALALATRKGRMTHAHNTNELATLSIDESRLKRGHQYSVETTTRDLRERPARQA